MNAARGTRDVSGQDAILRQQIAGMLKGVFELYGYNPLETPVLERYETLTSKYAGGEEILKEMFKLQDQGKRRLALRYDLTVPLARFLACNPNLKMPFKRYAIGSVFRDGPLKPGRYREFTQCDVDVVGNGSMAADAEIVRIALACFERLGFKVTVKVNNRKLLNGILAAAGVEEDKTETAILSLDKLEKFGGESVSAELRAKGLPDRVITKLMGFVTITGTNNQKLKQLRNAIGNNPGLFEMGEVLRIAKSGSVKFDVSLARGLAYYTGTVFEVFLNKSRITSAVAGGGRYDGMIGKFVRNNRDYPAVGISFGLDAIIDAVKMEETGLKTVTKAYVISIGEPGIAMEVAEKLRAAKVNCDTDFSGKVGKSIEYAGACSIPFVIFVGKREAKAGRIRIRNMVTGKERLVGVESAIRSISKFTDSATRA